MTKQLTGKQLGIPLGYRLSVANISNIVKVSVSHKFKSKLLTLATAEAKLLHRVNQQIFKQEDIDAFDVAVAKLTGLKTKNRGRGDKQELLIEGQKHQLGGNYDSYNHVTGVIANNWFKKMLSEMSPPDMKKKFDIVGSKYANHNMWLDKFCDINEPNTGVSIDPFTSFKRLNTKTKAAVLKHFAEVEALSVKIGTHIDLVKGLAYNYTSAVKLCNDAPEFVEWISNAKIYNKDGHKCTDVSTHDMIAQLRKAK